MKYIKLLWLLIVVLLSGCAGSARLDDRNPSNGGNGQGQGNRTAVIVFNGSTANISGNGAVFSDRTLTISRGGIYTLSGRLDNGQVLIDTGNNDTVQLVLNDVTLHNQTGPAIYAPGADELTITLESGTQNTVSDSARSGTSDQDAAIFIQGHLRITGNGSLTVNGVFSHGIRALGSLTISSGNYIVNTRTNGILSDGAVLISGGNIYVTDSYEGIEGRTVTITGGNIKVFSRDDGINASGGTSMNDMFIRISGGTVDVHVHADGDTDAIDSNGNIFLEGGTLRICGPSRIMAGAIDLDGQFVVSGGELITSGSVQSVAANSTQPVILLSYTGSYAPGSVISVRNSNGTTLLEHTSRNTFSYSGFTSPQFRVGETYSIFINNRRITDIRLNNVITRINSDGGAYRERGRR